MGKSRGVRTLPFVEKPDGILAFDFDGTMHWPKHKPPVDSRLLEWIEFLRERQQMIWGICTGRSMMHLMEGLSEGIPFLPDFAVTREREIFFPNRFGRFIPDRDWNNKCEKDHASLFKKVRRELKAVRKYVEEVAKGQWVEEVGDPAGVVLPHEDEMEGLLEEMARLCKGCPHLGHERNSIYLRFSHTSYNKGAVLQEISQRVGVRPKQVIAGGDNFNDLSLLKPEVTSRPVCPGNAVQDVKKLVRDSGGVVGRSVASAGLVEAFEELFVK